MISANVLLPEYVLRSVLYCTNGLLKVPDIIAILTCGYKDEVWNIIKESCWSSDVVIVDSHLRSMTSALREMGRFLVSGMISLLSRGRWVLLHISR